MFANKARAIAIKGTITATRPLVRWKLVLSRVAVVLLISTLALGLRLRAVALLPIDTDEDDYMRSAQLYAQHLAAGDLRAVINERDNYEHPPLTKLIYGVLLLAQGPESYAHSITNYGNKNGVEGIAGLFRPARLFAATVGALTVGLVAVVNPVAGLLVAINSWHIKYSAQAMLESLACFFAALTLLLLSRSKRSCDAPFWWAAVALGLTAANKYVYAVGGLAAVWWLLWRDWRSLWRLLPWGGLAILIFYLFDPTLWLDPIGRLGASVGFHADYVSSHHVLKVGYGWAQPLTWLMGADVWNPGVMPLLDGVFSIVGLLAIPAMWRRQRLVVLWFAVNMLFLFCWPTKWPQYIVAVTIPISLMAAQWFQDAASTVRRLQWLRPALVLIAAIAVYPLALQWALDAVLNKGKSFRGSSLAFWLATWRGILTLSSAGRLPYLPIDAVMNWVNWPIFLPGLAFNILWLLMSMGLATGLGIWLATLWRPRLLARTVLSRILFVLLLIVPEWAGVWAWNTLLNVTYVTGNHLTPSHPQWLTDPAPVVDFRHLAQPLVAWLTSLHLAPLAALVSGLAALFSTDKTFWLTVVMGLWVALPLMMLVAITAIRESRLTMTWSRIRPYIVAGAVVRAALLFNAFHIPLLVTGALQPHQTEKLSLIWFYLLRFRAQSYIIAVIDISILALVLGLMSRYQRHTATLVANRNCE